MRITRTLRPYITITVLDDAEPLPPPAAPPLTFETSHSVEPDPGIAALVCCDGSYPYHEAASGAFCEWNGDTGTWLQGAWGCTSRRGNGKPSVRQAVDVAQLAPSVAANFTVRMLVDDQLSLPQSYTLSVARDLSGPACLRFEILDLARGDIFVDERCVGDDIADQLGKIDIDPFADPRIRQASIPRVHPSPAAAPAVAATRAVVAPHRPDSRCCGSICLTDSGSGGAAVWRLLPDDLERHLEPGRPPSTRASHGHIPSSGHAQWVELVNGNGAKTGVPTAPAAARRRNGSTAGHAGPAGAAV